VAPATRAPRGAESSSSPRPGGTDREASATSSCRRASPKSCARGRQPRLRGRVGLRSRSSDAWRTPPWLTSGTATRTRSRR
jgi:hypothetical protein